MKYIHAGATIIEINNVCYIMVLIIVFYVRIAN